MEKNLSARQTQLLLLLLKADSYSVISSLARKLQVSYRTITYDLEVLASFLETKNLALQRRPGKGITIIGNKQDRELVLQKMRVSEALPCTIQIRRWIMMTYILWSYPQKIAISQLSDLFFVSSSSIIRDLQFMEEHLKKFNLSLNRTSRGTYLIGKELDIRNCLLEIFYRQGWNILEEAMKKQPSPQQINFTVIRSEIKKLTMDLIQNTNTMNEPYFSHMIDCLLISIIRIKQGQSLKKDDLIGFAQFSESEMSVAKNICCQINQKMAITFNEFEQQRLQMYMCSGGLSSEQTQLIEQKAINKDIKSLTIQYTKRLIQKVSESLNIDFTNDLFLHSKLRFHIKPMLSRLQFDIYIYNTYLEYIKNHFDVWFIAVYLCCIELSKEYQIPMINEEEAGFLVSYFQAALERNHRSKAALVISDLGIGLTQLLKQRIEMNFPEIKIVRIISSHQLTADMLNDADLMVSTEELNVTIPYALVSPYFLEADKAKIAESIFIKNQGQSPKSSRKIQIQPVAKMEVTAVNYQDLQVSLGNRHYTLYHDLTKNELYGDKQKASFHVFATSIPNFVTLISQSIKGDGE